jgi:hypothetical protein
LKPRGLRFDSSRSHRESRPEHRLDIPFASHHASVAHRTERRIPNPEVPGSTPGRGACRSGLMGKASVFQTEERGSSPRYGSHRPSDDAGSSNGRTLGFGPSDEGSSPSPAATPPRTACDPAFVPRATRFDTGRRLHASVAQPAEAPGRGPGMARVRILPDTRPVRRHARRADTRPVRRRSPTGRGVAFRTRRFGVRLPATARGGLTERQGAGLLTRGRVHPRAGSNPAPSARRRNRCRPTRCRPTRCRPTRCRPTRCRRTCRRQNTRQQRHTAVAAAATRKVGGVRYRARLESGGQVHTCGGSNPSPSAGAHHARPYGPLV